MLAEQDVKADMILTDPPYGTTHCRWDSPIDIPKMWQVLKGVTMPTTPILLFCQQPFTSVLGASNLKQLRYSWVWEKTQPTGFLNAKRMPMKAHEDILVFYDKLPTYIPIKTDGHKQKVVMASHQRKCNAGEIYHSTTTIVTTSLRNAILAVSRSSRPTNKPLVFTQHRNRWHCLSTLSAPTPMRVIW